MTKFKIGKKSGLKYFSIDDIRSFKPCYDPKKFLPEGWRGTAVDILNLKKAPFQDRLSVILRTEICSEKLMRLAAVWFYRDTLNWVKNPDRRSIEAANVAERFANGEATEEELNAAYRAALSALWSASSSGAGSARKPLSEIARRAAEERYKNKLIEMLKAEGKERKS